MRTIRTKVYQFSELSEPVRHNVVERYRQSLSLPLNYPIEKIEYWITRRNYEFKADGTRF